MKKIIKENIRVEVTPDVRLYHTDREKQALRICNSIESDIKRHIDDVDSIQVVWDTKEVCSFCGYTWDENGECCQAALDEFEQAHEQIKNNQGELNH